MRKTLWMGDFDIIHDRCEKVQNRMTGHILSSGPPSSARNVDSAGPANMSRDLLGKKSQLDLRPFGVGFPVVGRTEASKMSLLVARE